MPGPNRLPADGQLRASLRFLSHRLFRSIPRLLAQLLFFFVFVYLLAAISPSWLSDGLGGLLPWSRMDPSITRSTEDLRVVVFGSQDITGSAYSETDAERSSWALQLCKELSCTSYVSLVPTEDAAPGLTSNDVYRVALEEFRASVEGANILENPAADYEFLARQYPVPSKTPDLAAQVKQFLSRPPIEAKFRSTIWIFTFGTWDVWNLAALPLTTSIDVLDGMVDSMFEQVEQLYLSALDRDSNAFSNFWVGFEPDDLKMLTAPSASRRIDERALENFRIIIPKLFEINLAPAWQKRPAPSYPHTKAEHMQHAVVLTKQWNWQVANHLQEWQEKGRQKPDGMDDESRKANTNNLAKREREELASRKSQQVEKSTRAIPEGNPRRLGMQCTSGFSSMLDTMRTAQMQRGVGREEEAGGDQAEAGAMLFTNTWEACLASNMKFSAGQTDQLDNPCEVPDNHLFYDATTLSRRAIHSIASQTAKDVLQKLFPPTKP